MQPPSLTRRLRLWVQQHQRRVIALYLAGVLALFAVLGLWGVALGGAEQAVRAGRARWIAQLEAGEALLAAGRSAEAALQLARLDAEFPARTSKHRLDRERERLLCALGQSYLAQDKKRLALETYARLVDFDALNWRNHFERALACRRFNEDATEHFERALALNPSHLPSVAALIELAAEDGRFTRAISLWRRYLDAYLLVPVRLNLSGRSALAGGQALLEVPADGRFHVVETAVAAGAEVPSELCLETLGFSAQVDWIELLPPARAGDSAARPPQRLETTAIGAVDMVPAAEPARFAAAAPESRLCLALPAEQGAIGRVRARLRLFKALDAPTWQRIEKSCRNALDHEGLAEARDRSLVGGNGDWISALAD